MVRIPRSFLTGELRAIGEAMVSEVARGSGEAGDTSLQPLGYAAFIRAMTTSPPADAEDRAAQDAWRASPECHMQVHDERASTLMSVGTWIMSVCIQLWRCLLVTKEQLPSFTRLVLQLFLSLCVHASRVRLMRALLLPENACPTGGPRGQAGDAAGWQGARAAADHHAGGGRLTRIMRVVGGRLTIMQVGGRLVGSVSEGCSMACHA